MTGGIQDERWKEIVSRLRALGSNGDIVLFGSRAKGTFRPGSDIDLAVSDSSLDELWAARAKDALEEAFFPYSFDIIALSALHDDSVREHIARVGKKLA